MTMDHQELLKKTKPGRSVVSSMTICSRKKCCNDVHEEIGSMAEAIKDLIDGFNYKKELAEKVSFLNQDIELRQKEEVRWDKPIL